MTRGLYICAEKKLLLKAKQMHKMTTITFIMVDVVILSENSCHFVSCSAYNNSYFFSTIYKSRASWAKKQKTNTEVEYLGDICFSVTKASNWSRRLVVKCGKLLVKNCLLFSFSKVSQLRCKWQQIVYKSIELELDFPYFRMQKALVICGQNYKFSTIVVCY